ncbi:hypothetical protein LCGC14_2432770, partial [marine sediment metagenome]
MAKSDDIPGTDPARKVNRAVIEGLKAKALALPGSGARLCLHRDQTDAVQEMIIVHRKGAYVRPHRHDGQTESFHVLEGRMLVVIFDDEGNVTDRQHVAPSGGDERARADIVDEPGEAGVGEVEDADLRQFLETHQHVAPEPGQEGVGHRVGQALLQGRSC